MNLSSIFDGVLIGIAASVPLGPIGVLCIQRTLQRGKLSGFISGLGAATSDTLYAIIAGFSVSYIVAFIEEQFFWLQIFGAIILILLGIYIFRSNPAVQLRRQRKRKSSLFQDFISTFFITISNPLAVFLFIAFFASFRSVNPDMGIGRQLILIGGVFIGASLWWLILTSIVSLFRSVVNLRRLFWINKIAGASIIILVIIAMIVWILKEFVF